MELSAGYLQDNKLMRKLIIAPLYRFENTSVFIYEKENYIIVVMGKNETEKSRITHPSTPLSAGRYTHRLQNEGIENT